MSHVTSLPSPQAVIPAQAGIHFDLSHKHTMDPGLRRDDEPHVASYAELHALSNFSFQRGASSADELFARARELDYAALAITDECSMAGIVRALEASRSTGVALIVGSEIRIADGPTLVLLAASQHGYTELCRLITLGRRRADKGSYQLNRVDVETLGPDVLVLWPPQPESAAAQRETDAAWLREHFSNRAWLAVELHHGPDDAAELVSLRVLAARHQLPLVATGNVHMHARGRRALQDVMVAIRTHCTVSTSGHALFANGERHLRTLDELKDIYPEDLRAETLRIAERCRFNLGDLNYEYPHELVPPGLDASSHLRQLTFAGATLRWPNGMPAEVRTQVDKELTLIDELGYQHFFLTVHDIVAWARSQQPPILCQGRGSAANSAVCFCLGITSVDPERGNLLFERFLSKERDEPPDIDVDFEHERRELVLQYVFRKYGRERAALAATVICYRGKSAGRDVGRTLGLPEDQLDRLASLFSRLRGTPEFASVVRELGFDPDSRVLQRWAALVSQLRGAPRHLSQHVGGFVISEQPLHHLVPVENAAMLDRTIIQWDKDDLETMRLLKVDCLALGMLTCLRKCLDLLRAHGGPSLELATIPAEDRATYDMICRADTIGVFQIESRAQMSMLPRLKPRTFYDLVVQIAIIRPGPIQGDMVHPYLRRRRGEEAIEPLPPELDAVLARTCGIPIFQEQVMKLVEVAAGFTPGEADQLRRSMAAWKRRGGLEPFREQIFAGMHERGYDDAYAARIFEQIKGFGEYGFPESHAASFALLAYASAWLKCHHPAAFACALLNSQPMGFYQPAQIVHDVQAHDVQVLPIDVTCSDVDCTLQQTPSGLALRLGLRMLRGASASLKSRLVEARAQAPFRDLADLCRRARLERRERALLAEAGALESLSKHRHQAHWDSAGLDQPAPLLVAVDAREQAVAMRAPSRGEDILRDYASHGLSLRGHPLALLRKELHRRRMRSIRDLLDHGSTGSPRTGCSQKSVRCAGLVTSRQHPGTAGGVTFLTIEDETGTLNVIVWRSLGEAQHQELTQASILGIDGSIEHADGVTHLIASRLHDLSTLLPELAFRSRDFH